MLLIRIWRVYRFMIQAVILHIGVSGFEMLLDYSCANCAYVPQGLQFSLVPSIVSIESLAWVFSGW